MHPLFSRLLSSLASAGFVALLGSDSDAQVHWIETGHFYDVIEGSFTWDEAKADAESRVFLGIPGHLAAIATDAENSFITSRFATSGAFLGGVQAVGGSEPAGGWTWITGEGFFVTSWAAGEPNDSYAGGLGSAPMGTPESILAYSTIDPTRWADFPRHSDVRSKYIIEWEPRFFNPHNEHYYVQVDGPFSWSEGQATAQALTHLGIQGHLATITSALENEWVAQPPNVFRRLFNTGGLLLGGYQDPFDSAFLEPAGGWKWITGEPWSFTSWHSDGSPVNHWPGPGHGFEGPWGPVPPEGTAENVLQYSPSSAWTWNDIPDHPNIKSRLLVEFDGGTPPCTSMPVGMRAWWRGEGDASDTAGMLPGTLSGGTYFVPALVGLGFGFDSNDDRVSVAHSTELNINASGFTCEFWMRGTHAQPAGDFALVEKSHGFVDSTGWYIAGDSTFGTIGFGFGTGSTFVGVGAPGLDVLDGVFHHVAATWFSGTGSLYIDGRLRGSFTGAPAGNTRSVNFAHVWGGGTPQRFFRGSLDEVRIFDRALSSLEVSALYFARGSSICPTADAGPDQTVDENTLVQLDGTNSSGAPPLSYAWTQISGSTVALSDPEGPQPQFASPFVPIGGETLTFSLVVSSLGVQSDPDIVNIRVQNVNLGPVADAGPVQTVSEGAGVTLDGSGSFDPDMDPLTYVWSQSAGPGVTLATPDSIAATFEAPVVGPEGTTLTFELTVSDGTLAASSSTSVQVLNVNVPPIADAGSDQTVDESTQVVLDGTLSRDPDGEPLTYYWVQTAGPLVVLDITDAARPAFDAPAVGAGGAELRFALQVCDPELACSAEDEVALLVRDVGAPPSCEGAQGSSIWPPNHALVPATIRGVTDPDSSSPVTITILSVRQDEPINGLGDGDTGPDAVIVGGQLYLRAERSGTGNGRVYHVTFLATDASGDTCTGTATFDVPHSKKAKAVDGGPLHNSLGN